MDESGPVVEPAIPAFLGKLDTGGARATRLDLANWLVSPHNPLTARVFVNRTWRQFFGIGLSKMLDDLGSQGEWPTHPELLDWLAAEFMQPSRSRGAHWDMKHLIRTIVTSHTYRQSSLPTPESSERDPDNRLLARQSRFRVDAEVVRDIALDVSGLLVEKFGGPSVRPYRAGRLPGGAELSQARILRQPRRRSLPPRRLHALAAHLPASQPARPSMRRRARSAPSTARTRTRRCRRWSC